MKFWSPSVQNPVCYTIIFKKKVDRSIKFQSPSIENPSCNVMIAHTHTHTKVDRSIEFWSPQVQNLGRNAATKK
jgi:hypothetical protein